ncbi:MAG TPA: cbb3-type cytochrome c oxidase N-terminal domain-containing protein [Longimicrobiales bacterium]|nr:cbb3-type cytochrome c oxidase N-terminal domain-containing protein [Longimicrobiales bacterium]
MSKETNRILGHADESDGIEEYDNPLPDWWVGLFWFTIVWAIGYGVWYHAIADRSQVKLLAAEMAAAEAAFPAQPASEAAAMAALEVTPDAVAAGAAVFAQNCVACHGANLEGGIGPSFVDAEWIHGGQAQHIVGIITNGVLEKGMVRWQGILSPEQINQVAAYVISKHSQATGRPVEEIMKPAGAAGEPDAAAAAAAPPVS